MVAGDFGSAFNAQLSTPLGLALNRDHTPLSRFGAEQFEACEEESKDSEHA